MISLTFDSNVKEGRTGFVFTMLNLGDEAANRNASQFLQY